MSQPSPRPGAGSPVRLPPDGSRGSVLVGALYSLGFYIALSLVMTLGEGFGGAADYAWVAVAAAWLAVAVRFLLQPRARNTGLGMIGSVVVIVAVFALLGLVLHLTFGGG